MNCINQNETKQREAKNGKNTDRITIKLKKYVALKLLHSRNVSSSNNDNNNDNNDDSDSDSNTTNIIIIILLG
ncbi:hypothetical protein MKS88_004361 [Plasmodium brasilianum]|uniref:Uncharacterized protein n=1 Tax=Plasmodium brasilianum TaxID=5824 RepID=A0ACB9Y5E9_PLABR|nr:hypothetical protein MKS88_004361 [Plasmodium brasilianum]